MSRTATRRVQPVPLATQLENRRDACLARADAEPEGFLRVMHQREAETYARALAKAQGVAVDIEPTRHILNATLDHDYAWRKTNDGVSYVPINL